MCSAIAYEAKVLRGCDSEERVVVGTEGKGIGVEGKRQECVWHGGLQWPVSWGGAREIAIPKTDDLGLITETRKFIY